MMAGTALSCRELVELVTEYLEGKQRWRDRRRFDRHIKDCNGCRTYLDQMRRTIRATGMLREEDIPEGVRTALLDAFRGWRRPR